MQTQSSINPYNRSTISSNPHLRKQRAGLIRGFHHLDHAEHYLTFPNEQRFPDPSKPHAEYARSEASDLLFKLSNQIDNELYDRFHCYMLNRWTNSGILKGMYGR